ncbi:hypothetical protein [Candidatus Nitrospira allomarina]|uniref:Uncharacterized protein n=1 Tax=Candidatus Nitrospira allomarina TaxID=3020900 RepID=A0AA96GGA9_9BACT|nr:hypothetical protein [Candidatus Nitrospira allomarina]WNM58353.1 hypothetical protein PP769_00915 [Candidatus Nitrospira allomarina]
MTGPHIRCHAESREASRQTMGRVSWAQILRFAQNDKIEERTINAQSRRIHCLYVRLSQGPAELAQILRFTQDDMKLEQDDHLEIFLQQLSGI